MSKWHNLLFCWDLSSGTSEGFCSSAGGPADTNHQRRECSLVRMWLDSSPHVPAEPPIKGQERCSNCNGNDITEMNQCSKVRPWGCTSIPLERTRTALKRLDFLMTFLWFNELPLDLAACLFGPSESAYMTSSEHSRTYDNIQTSSNIHNCTGKFDDSGHVSHLGPGLQRTVFGPRRQSLPHRRLPERLHWRIPRPSDMRRDGSWDVFFCLKIIYKGCKLEWRWVKQYTVHKNIWAVFFFIARGLYTGMEATPKAPQGYHLWKRRLRAPTRDTFAYAKRLREESHKDLFHLSTEQLQLTKKNLTNRCLTKRVGLEGFVSGIQTEQGNFWTSTTDRRMGKDLWDGCVGYANAYAEATQRLRGDEN